MKKILFLVSFLTTLAIINVVPCLADCIAGYYNTQLGWVIYRFADNTEVYAPSVHSNYNEYQLYGYMYYFGSGFSSYEEAMDAAQGVSAGYNSWGQILQSTADPYQWINTFFKGSWNYYGSGDLPDYNPETDPDEPEPGSNWLSDVWEWFLWQLGLNDDYSGDIDAYITGGDRERMEMVTPSPTPSPTPLPSPTPYSLDIIDNNGNPVYTITGIPGSTYNITNTTNNNDGSDFDIFEVDLKIGDGGSTNPRDGLNDVMDTSLNYLSDPENVNMQPVGDSFSIIPNDWFLILGVVACFPFIAGFISKLLK